MRIWILFTGTLIGEVINPGYDYPDIYYIYFTILFIGGLIMDLTEFKSRITK